MNEPLCRALLRAGLTEEEAATSLGVDPKTVRRWMEGRSLPYPRHRWALAAMLGTDEADLWPELRHTRPRSEEVQAVYPHRDAAPRSVWLRLFGSAEHEIAILDRDALFLVQDHQLMDTLRNRARAGIRVRICLAVPDSSCTDEIAVRPWVNGPTAGPPSDLALFLPLLESGGMEMRFHSVVLYNSIYRADDQLLVTQSAYGIPPGRAAVLHLRIAERGMAGTYLHSFDQIWANALTVQ